MIGKCHESVKRFATNRKYHHLLLIWRVLVRFLRRSTSDSSLCPIVVDGALTKKIEPRVSGSIEMKDPQETFELCALLSALLSEARCDSSVAGLDLCREKTRVEIHIFFASHDKCYAVMHCLWRHGQWALPITTNSLPPRLFNEQGVGVDFEHQAQLSFRLFLIGRIEKN